ncbi:acyltransferase [Tricladium varicosporioides]|nr:acyltransferase [Hymenoscyphus varicosporioides]
MQAFEQVGEPRRSRLVSASRKFIRALTPSIFTRGSEGPLTPTSYLDGLRGFAAFLVYWQHHQIWARIGASSQGIFENAYGHNGNHYFATLPFIRLFFSGGPFAVALFFVISGYVLSNKPLQLINSNEHAKLGDNLASALFRRWIRLYLPIIATTLVYLTSWHVFKIWTPYPQQEKKYKDELWSWYLKLKNFSFVFDIWQGGPPWFAYNFHLWSIPVEFRGSVIIYTTLLAFSNCRRNMRLLCEVGLICYFMYIVDGALYALFVSGMLLCDLDLLSKRNDLPALVTKFAKHKKGFFYILFVTGVFLGGVPIFNNDIKNLAESPGWHYLSLLKPEAVQTYRWFYLFFSGTFIVASIPHISWLQRFFEMQFNQYLGHISFALYLVHGPILWTLSDRVYLAAGWTREDNIEGVKQWANLFPLSKAGPLGLEWAFLLPQLIILPVTLWCAEVATRLLDEPSISIARWSYGKFLRGGVK